MTTETPRLKDFFNARVVKAIADEIAAVHPPFPKAAFTQEAVRGLSALELTGRGWHLADALHRHLPQPFPQAAAVLLKSLPKKTAPRSEEAMGPFQYLPHTYFAAKYGLEHFEPAMKLQYELTQRFTAEFSIRAFLERHPAATYARLTEWAGDESEHVRRLVSEGTRPRLPWAPRLRAFQKDPAPVLRLLERLKDDPSMYVRRSVANNLNDIGKDHPELLVEVCRRWKKGASEERTWVIQHGLRSLVKKSHPGALEVLGFAGTPDIALKNIVLRPKQLHIGEKLRLSFELWNEGRKPQTLLVDFLVHFVKSTGEAKPKVFKLSKLDLKPGAHAELRSTVSFQQLTTRRHYPGRHRLELQVNGVLYTLGTVEVRNPR